MALLWFCLISETFLSVIFISLILYLQNKKYNRLAKQIAICEEYVANVALKHNLLSKEVVSHANEIFFQKEFNSMMITDQNEKMEKIENIQKEVNYIMGNWQSEWDDGNSWKNGIRPDGTVIDKDEEYEGDESILDWEEDQ